MNTENKSHTPKQIRDLWQTPAELYNTLDAAASSNNHLAPLFIDESMNALGDAVWAAVPCYVGELQQVDSLDETELGEGGFGSTDK